MKTGEIPNGGDLPGVAFDRGWNLALNYAAKLANPDAAESILALQMLGEAREYIADALDAHEHSDGRDLLNRMDAALSPKAVEPVAGDTATPLAVGRELRAFEATAIPATDAAREGGVALTVAREIIAYIDRKDGAPGVANGVLAGRYDCADDVAFATAKIAAALTASPSTNTVLREAQIAHMTERFLSWKLPSDFRPDAGISFKADYNEHTARPMKHEPSGTNLFDAQQAEVMVRHMLEGWPS